MQDEAMSFYRTLAKTLGCDQKNQIACLRQLPYQAACLRNAKKIELSQSLLPAEGKIAEAAWSALGFEGGVQSVGLQVGDLPITATPLWPALPVSFVVDGSPRGLPATPRELYEAHQVYLDHGTDEGTIFAGLMYAAYPWYKAPELTHAATDEIMTWAFNSSIIQIYPRYPNSVFYAETTFAGGEATESSNWLSALINRSLVEVSAASRSVEEGFFDPVLLEELLE
eukprot:Skav229801  [mRNA]  locus=scaffold567:159660:164211:- [translate_table: standard]